LSPTTKIKPKPHAALSLSLSDSLPLSHSLTKKCGRKKEAKNDFEFDFLDPLFTHQLRPPRHRLLRGIHYTPLLSF